MNWASIEEFPAYSVSNTGEVKAASRQVVQTSRWGLKMTRTYFARILRQKKTPQGYLQVVLSSQESGRKTFNVHALVAKSFVEGFYPGLCVNHKDGVKTNNHHQNLEWVTTQRNIEHAFEMGLAHIPFGVTSNACKGVVEAVNFDGVVVAEFAGTLECRELGFTPCGVSAVLHGRQAHHRNLKFRFKEK